MRIMRHQPGGRTQNASATKPTAIAVGYLSAWTVVWTARNYNTVSSPGVFG